MVLTWGGLGAVRLAAKDLVDSGVRTVRKAADSWLSVRVLNILGTMLIVTRGDYFKVSWDPMPLLRLSLGFLRALFSGDFFFFSFGFYCLTSCGTDSSATSSPPSNGSH